MRKTAVLERFAFERVPFSWERDRLGRFLAGGTPAPPGHMQLKITLGVYSALSPQHSSLAYPAIVNPPLTEST